MLREFVKKGLLEAIGIMGSYWVRLNAAGWYEKGVLTDEDMADIATSIESCLNSEETEVAEDENLS